MPATYERQPSQQHGYKSQLMTGGLELSAAWALEKPAGAYAQPVKWPHQANLTGDISNRTHAIMAQAEVWFRVSMCAIMCARMGAFMAQAEDGCSRGAGRGRTCVCVPGWVPRWVLSWLRQRKGVCQDLCHHGAGRSKRSLLAG
eukprot:scaffold228808_cov20-Tisochrysis_lutea.AAC.2